MAGGSYDKYTDKGPTIIVVICSVSAISTLFTLGRLFVKGSMHRRINIDDLIIAFSVVCGWIGVGFSIAAVKSGAGRHMETLSQEQISGAILWTMVGFGPGVLSFTLPKIAVVCLLTRLLAPTRAHTIFLFVMTIFCCLSIWGCIIILFFQCTPPRSAWDFSIKGTCLSKWILVNYSRYAGSLSAAVDLYLAMYPAWILWNLQMSARKKIALSGALGIGATIVAIYKTTSLAGLADKDFSCSWMIMTSNPMKSNAGLRFAGSTSELTMWTVTEGSTIIIAACIPLLQPLLELILGRRAFSSRGSSKQGNYQKYNDLERNDHSNHGIELSKTPQTPRKWRKMGLQPGLDTIMATVKDENNGSQEIILENDINRDDRNSSRHASREITRVDEVRVTYDVRHSRDGAKSWEKGTRW